ncbi:hypothetical protein CYG49_04855 [Candidatus Saccharibacteria bacterium]|nr:MAG: hypothetical protein CYG49_04855 [Candidatus Saccharibacteria bacterium]
MMQLNLDGILQKEMDRKDFLKHLAIGAVAATGIGTIIKAVAPQSGFNIGSQAGSTQNQVFGYGGSVYGGGQERQVHTTARQS